MSSSPADPSEEPLFRRRIRAAYDQFSPSYRRVADFLLDDYRTAAFLNASGLAQHLDVDPATIVRFAQRLGYPGYPQLAKEIQDSVKRELTASFTEGDDGPDGDALRQTLAGLAEDVSHLLVVNAAHTLRALIEALLGARRVFVVAGQFHRDIADALCCQLRLAGADAVSVVGDRTRQGFALLGAQADDVALALALDPAGLEVYPTLQALQQFGLPTFAIVQSHSSAAARVADHTLVAPRSAGPDSPLPNVAALALLTAIAEAITRRNAERTAAQRAELQGWLDRLDAGKTAADTPPT